MINVAALADLHLGFQAYHATTKEGRNAREADVEATWHQAVKLIIERRPKVDLVTIAGDIFHTLRPSTHALIAFRDGCRALSDAGIAVVAITGNHEAAKSASTRTPIDIPADLPNIYCISQPQGLVLQIRKKSVSIQCVPHVTLKDNAGAEIQPPDSGSDHNIVLMHAAVTSSAAPNALPSFYTQHASGNVADWAAGFDAVLLGDYHEYTRLVPGRLVLYSGSLDYTSSNIWDETQPKGIPFMKLDGKGEVDFVELNTRGVLTDVLWGGAGAVNEWLEDALEHEEPGRIMRLVAKDFPRSDRSLIDRSLELKLKGHALHFQLDIHTTKGEAVQPGQITPGAGRGLAAIARERFANSPNKSLALALMGIEGSPHDPFGDETDTSEAE